MLKVVGAAEIIVPGILSVPPGKMIDPPVEVCTAVVPIVLPPALDTTVNVYRLKLVGPPVTVNLPPMGKDDIGARVALMKSQYNGFPPFTNVV
jgi:hypothetical protein